ncbi:hypothetical protein [Labrys wisconsinensis]|uniref:Lipoprotein n=1 Tax=Labrys wisconsinensis TaxID=425677 RepID=A0ABU0J585_9HYPH|nr:hypothetical protein [Labrys wisconsinensis]MDQ0468721.1 hypothetical protein [Labrys wisconsinensis]
MQKPLALVGLAVLGASLSGCATPTDRSASFTRTTISGREIRVQTAHEVNPDCSLLRIPVVQIMTKPNNGTLRIVQEASYPQFPKINPRWKCNSEKISGVSVYYKPNPGFAGSDDAVLRLSYSDGVVATNTIHVDVK